MGRSPDAGSLQAGSGAGHKPGVVAQVARAQRGIGQAPHAQRDVDALFDEVRPSNLHLQYDIYRAQRTEGEPAAKTGKHLARIAYIQAADNPGREGCEYKTAGTTEVSLQWLEAARRQLPAQK